MKKGFTLIELIMVIVILGILAAVAIPRFVDLSTEANTAACDGFKGAIASAASIYYANEAAQTGTAAFPPDTTTLGAEGMADGVWPTCPATGTIGYDSSAGTASCGYTGH